MTEYSRPNRSKPIWQSRPWQLEKTQLVPVPLPDGAGCHHQPFASTRPDALLLALQITFSNDINISKQFPIREKMGLELRASLFNPFNQIRRQDINSTFTYKMKGKELSDGYYLYNSPEMQVTNLLTRLPNSNELEKYNQYRNGVGHQNMTSVLGNRIIEIGLRLRF